MPSAPKTRSARPARPAAPPLPDFELLDDTHRRTLLVLADLERLPGLLGRADARSGEEAATLAQAACKFFNQSARAHHDAEETLVFPSLLRGGDPVLLAHVRQLQQDHNWLEEDWLELEPHLQAVASGFDGQHVDFLRTALPEFTELHHHHIALEEQVIYPEARRRAAQGSPA